MNDNNKKVISIRKEILYSKFIIKDQKLNDVKISNLSIQNSIKQRLYQLLINLDFNKKILNFFDNKKKVLHPLPSEWIKLLKKRGVKVSLFSYVMFQLFKVKVILKSLKIIILALNFKEIKIPDKFYYVHNINKDILQKDNNNFFLWIDKFFNENINILTHNYFKKDNFENGKFKILKYDIFQIKSIKIFLKIFLFYIKKSVEFLLYNSLIIIILDELIKLEIISINKIPLPNRVLIDNSDIIFKPLWTYYLEDQKCDCNVFFYSTNNSPIIFETQYQNQMSDLITHGWELMNWKKYLVWNLNQMNFFINYFKIEKENFTIAGPIPYEGGKIFNIKSKKKIISVFDVSPFEYSYYKNMCLPSYYYSFENLKKFYDDLCKITNKLDVTLIFKIKRISKYTDKNYVNYINKLKKLGYRINEDYSSFELIKSSEKVISMPFSSPSIIAKYYNIKSVFFDPTDKLIFLNKNKLFNYDIDILNKKELEKWI